MEEEGGVEGTGEQGGTRGTGEGIDIRAIANPTTEEVTKGEGATKEGATKDTTISNQGRGGGEGTEAPTGDGAMPQDTRKSTCNKLRGARE